MEMCRERSSLLPGREVIVLYQMMEKYVEEQNRLLSVLINSFSLIGEKNTRRQI